uniref:hypothetical protein n=1 Tax=Shewanella schlegeliana TaxID=190308 RepID=UPI0038B51AA4
MMGNSPSVLPKVTITGSVIPLTLATSFPGLTEEIDEISLPSASVTLRETS